MMKRATLEQQRVLVVGGSSGIGLAVAKLAKRQGAHVIVASRNASQGTAESSDLPADEFRTYSFDIIAPKEHKQLFGTVGNIDHLVITVRPKLLSLPFSEVGIDEAKSAFETKFWGPYQLIQVAQSHIRNTGSITLTSGIAGEKLYKGASTMALINSATETLCRTLAVELAPLRVNAVSPGFVEPKQESVQEQARHFPAKRWASLDDVAPAYLWLMADGYVTGTVSVVDGGARLL